MTLGRKKRCKACNTFATLGKEEKCEECAREESEEKSGQCDRCRSEVQDGQDGVCCEVCRGWFHAKCEGLSKEKYEELQEKEEEPWWCKKCIVLAMKHLETSKKIREERGEWKQEREKYDAEVKELRECLGALERENMSLKKEIEEHKRQNRGTDTPRGDASTQVDHAYAGSLNTTVAAKKPPACSSEGVEQSKEQAVKEDTAGSRQEAAQEGTGQPIPQQSGKEGAAASSQEGNRPSGQQPGGGTAGSGQETAQRDAAQPIPLASENPTDSRQEAGTVGTTQGEEAARGGAERCRQQAAAADTWVGVGKLPWMKIGDGKRLHMKTSGRLQRRVWLFGDSLLRGVGREMHFLSRGYYRIMDRCEPGANVKDIQKILEEHVGDIGQDDLVVLEGGGNGLLSTGSQETVDAYKEMVRLVRGKVKQQPLIVCIPKRRGRETSVFGEKRRWVNTTMIEKLEEWSCDGLQLWERMSWSKVWARDGVHMSKLGIVWMAWNVVEWAQHREKEQA